jgi:hypothetical protein
MLSTLLYLKIALRRHAPAGMTRRVELGEGWRRDRPWAKTAGPYSIRTFMTRGTMFRSKELFVSAGYPAKQG